MLTSGNVSFININIILLYVGYAGGGRFDQTGSAAEPVCLPTDPNFGRTTGYDHGRMCGAEFESRFWGLQIPITKMSLVLFVETHILYRVS